MRLRAGKNQQKVGLKLRREGRNQEHENHHQEQQKEEKQMCTWMRPWRSISLGQKFPSSRRVKWRTPFHSTIHSPLIPPPLKHTPLLGMCLAHSRPGCRKIRNPGVKINEIIKKPTPLALRDQEFKAIKVFVKEATAFYLTKKQQFWRRAKYCIVKGGWGNRTSQWDYLIMKSGTKLNHDYYRLVCVLFD